MCLLALAVVAGIISTSKAVRMDLKFMQNYSRAERFKCKEPQPRAVRALDLLLEHRRHSEYIIPAMTVLHRCDSGSGCCLLGDHMACKPLQQQNVTLMFQLVDMKKGPRIFSVQAVNHTKCGCVEISSYSPSLGEENSTHSNDSTE
ncbi:hypothetical protein J437_LFUL005556 [Ladona fulva]|uniref:Platelet-derived growth factor (PDGF) family profile domain-containing protein n=1 Tax=Ladona fulva TaxID=123851 RepID=A0A8K0K864_LADFU|nr:hypothetical protein J437_LFUL005556 [Ladona fulva]